MFIKHRQPTFAEVESALFSLTVPRFDSRGDWIKVGQALHSFDSGPDGLGLWVRFSQQSSKFKPGECEKKWQGFKPDGGITIATLFDMAKEDGWVYDPQQIIEPCPQPQPINSKPIRNAFKKIYPWVLTDGPEAVYFYNQISGLPLYRKPRYHIESSKITPFQRYDAACDCWVGGQGCMAGVQRVLYRNEHIQFHQRIFIGEGEKVCDLLWSLGFLATTNDSGAGHWRPEFSEALRGKDCIILADVDPAGHRHAQFVARSLYRIARSVKVPNLPGLADLAPKADVFDWLMAGGQVE